MPSKIFYCYECSNEFKVTTKSKDDICHCVFCGTPLEDADVDEERDED